MAAVGQLRAEYGGIHPTKRCDHFGQRVASSGFMAWFDVILQRASRKKDVRRLYLVSEVRRTERGRGAARPAVVGRNKHRARRS